MGRFLVLLWSFALLAGCGTLPTLTNVDYRFADIPGERRIEVVYVNSSRTTMCLLPEHWPNEAGKINQASDVVFLMVAGERFSLVDSNTGYCPQGCATRVAPGEKVTGSIPYADFGLPERLWGASKALEFSPRAFACPAR